MLNSSIGISPPLNSDGFLTDKNTHKPNGKEVIALITCADISEPSLGRDFSLLEWRNYLLSDELTQLGRFVPALTEGFQGPCTRTFVSLRKYSFSPSLVYVLCIFLFAYFGRLVLFSLQYTKSLTTLTSRSENQHGETIRWYFQQKQYDRYISTDLIPEHAT